MQKEDVKFQDSTVFEGMTSIRAIIKGSEAGVNDRKIEKILYDKAKAAKNIKELGYLKAISREKGFSLIETDAEELSRLTLGTSSGGIVAVAGNRSIPAFTAETSLPADGFYVMIQGIEDPYNFGYALRSLYACGASGVILPERNWFSAAGVVCRSSAGASELFPVFTADPLEAAKIFHEKGYRILCADERTDDLLGEADMKLPVLLIAGGEKRGISKELLNLCDLKVRIPYARDFRASLSAASAVTMFAYEIMRQNRK